MPSVSYPIVGAHYHPPARAILNFLPIGHPLILLPEPTNHVDPNALAVWIMSETLPSEGGDEWESTLAGFGLTWDQLKSEPFWHLGYIPAAVAAKYASEGGLTLDSDGRLMAEFTVGAQGGPRIRWET
jgi:hypothetical protein